jgi:hypothetical protein
MTLDDNEAVDVRGLAAVINARIVADAWVTKAHAFAWLCGGAAIAVCLAALGAAAALYGYSCMISNKPAAEQAAKAIADALERAEWKTTVSGSMTLAPNTELRLAQGQAVNLADDTIVKLDPNSSVRIIGDLQMPQPSKRQLQQEAMSRNDELPFTSYVIFRSVPLGSGVVETGWLYDLSDTLRPRTQYCHYRQAFDEGLIGKISLAVDGSPKVFSPLMKLPFKPDEALANCIWFSGY